MNEKSVQTWNESNRGISIEREPSSYAQERERLFPPDSLVCDLGSGIGTDSLYFFLRGHRVVLLDISDYALSTFQKTVQNYSPNRFQTQQVDLSEGKIPQPEKKFDVVFSRLALHFFPKTTFSNLLGEARRILKPQGRAFISVKSPNDKKEMEFLRRHAKEIEPGVFEENGIIKTRLTDGQIREILNKLGIKNYQIGEYRETLDRKNDLVKSGNKELLLTEIVIRK